MTDDTKPQNVVRLVMSLEPAPPISCPGVGRDAGNDRALCFYLSRPVSDDEMRLLHSIMQRAVACLPPRPRISVEPTE